MVISNHAAAATGGTLHAAVTYQKLAGTLALNDSLLTWTPSSSSSSSAASLAIPLDTVSGLSVSKAGAAKVSLQIALYDQDAKVTALGKGKVLFTFTGGINNDQAQSEAEREEYKAALIEVVSRNRARMEGSAMVPASVAAAPASVTPVAALTARSTPAVGSPSAGIASRTESPAVHAVSAADREAAELRLRFSLLRANPSLQALHKQTVMSGMIPDTEFWAHPSRQSLLRAARQAAGQQKGRNARIVDPRFQSDNDGNLRLEITDDDRRDLLDQNEVLRLAHKENVPNKLDEATFWQRYFASSLYHVLRTSSRSSSLLNNSRTSGGGPVSRSAIVQPDDIFDSYLPLVQAKYVDSLEPPPREGGQREAQNRLIDLGATESDHNDRGNEKDWTMRGGAERGVLPLVRRFNEHSERVLSSSLGDHNPKDGPSLSGEILDAEQISGSRRSKRARTEGERGVELEDQIPSAHAQRYEEEIVIEDLEERRERMAVPLELAIGEDSTSRHRSKAQKGGRGAQSPKDLRRPSKSQVLQNLFTSLSGMPKNGTISLPFLNLKQSSSQKGLSWLLEDELRVLLLARKDRGYFDLQELPDHLRKRTMDLHGTTTEVLRHFWHAITPPDEDDGRMKLEEGEDPPVPPTAAEREEKAQRMLSILRRIPSQVEELLHQSGGGADEEKIASALAITLDASKKAVVVGEQVYGD